MTLKYNIDNINIGKNGEYFYVNDYIPVSKTSLKYVAAPDAVKYSRLILRYKKADNTAITFFTQLLNNIIHNYFYFYDLILPVPSSSSYLDCYPNNVVCLYLSAFGTINTLRGAVVCDKGHKPGHITGTMAKKKGSKYLCVKDKYDFKSKNIIVFDDIITTGTTFDRIRELLLKRGANSVIGLFLGRTRCDFLFRQEDF